MFIYAIPFTTVFIRMKTLYLTKLYEYNCKISKPDLNYVQGHGKPGTGTYKIYAR